MFRNILVVCIGNICRSPTAEIVLRRALDRNDINVSSAGLHALVGKPIDPTAGQLLTEHGLASDLHLARQATPAVLGAADLILTMERKHLDSISRVAPHVSGKSFLLGKWHGNCEIPDPYRQHREAFEHVYGLIERSVDGWLRYIR